MVSIALCLVGSILGVVCETDSRGMWVGVGFWLGGLLSWLIQELLALSESRAERDREELKLADLRSRKRLAQWAAARNRLG